MGSFRSFRFFEFSLFFRSSSFTIVIERFSLHFWLFYNCISTVYRGIIAVAILPDKEQLIDEAGRTFLVFRVKVSRKLIM
jgi:hypothetical protein